jgi:hypothetical protein
MPLPSYMLPPILDVSANPIIPIDSSYVGLFYAYEASGGYVMEEGLTNIVMIPYEKINKIDVTESLQVKFDVRTFNKKIGLIKDASNTGIINSSYDPATNHFPFDKISLPANEFVSGMNTSQVISVGKYTTLYSDFQMFLESYFGYPAGFSSLFTIKSQIDIHGGVFDASALMNLMTYKALNASGEYVNTVSGEITIQHVNALLRFANQYNPFNNRTSSQSNIRQGFIDKDLIFIPTGTQVTLYVNIKNVDAYPNFVSITPAGTTNIQATSGDYTNGNFSQVTTVTSDYIKRVVKVPLLIRLTNLSTS